MPAPPVGRFTFYPRKGDEPIVATLGRDLVWTASVPGWAAKLQQQFPPSDEDDSPAGGARGHALLRRAAAFFDVAAELADAPSTGRDAVH